MSRFLTWIVVHSAFVKRSLLVGVVVLGVGLVSGWIPRILLRVPGNGFLQFTGRCMLTGLGDQELYEPLLRARLHAETKPKTLAFSFRHKYAGEKLVTITFRDLERTLRELALSGRHPELCRPQVIVKARLLVLGRVVGEFSPGTLKFYGTPATGPGVRYILFTYSCPEQVPLDQQCTLHLSFIMNNPELARRYGPMVLEVVNYVSH